MQMNSHCSPPQAVDVEESILAGAILHPATRDIACDHLHSVEFYKTAHQTIFAAIAEMHRDQQQVDLPTLAEFLKSKRELERIGGAAYLATLVDQCPISTDIKSHVRIVKEKALLRRLISTCNDIANGCFERQSDVEALVDTAQTAILQVDSNFFRDNIVSMRDLSEAAEDRYNVLAAKRGGITGVPSGFADVDRMTCGWQNGDLVIVAARPAIGKTAFALNMALNMAKNNYPTGFLSLEMSKEQLYDRAVAAESRVNGLKFRMGGMNQEDFCKITNAQSALFDLPFYVDDTAGVNAMGFRRAAKRMVKKYNVKCLMTDYLQLMTGSGESRRDLEIANISRAMKITAKELGTPVIALSQLNRKLEERSDKRPMLSDLRESGALEQDADIVLFLYRREVYNDWKGFEYLGNKYTTPPQHPPEDVLTAFKSSAEVIIAKQRSGPIGAVPLRWFGRTMQFRSAAARGE